MFRSTRSTIFGTLLLILALGHSSAASGQSSDHENCNCACQPYRELVLAELPPAREAELLQCAGACAMAWVRCESVMQSLAQGAADSEDDSTDRSDNKKTDEADPPPGLQARL